MSPIKDYKSEKLSFALSLRRFILFALLFIPLLVTAQNTPVPSKQSEIKLGWVEKKGSSMLWFKNLTPAPLNFQVIDKQTDSLVKSLLYGPNDSLVLIHLARVPEDSARKYVHEKFKIEYRYGDPSVRIKDTLAVYQIPLKPKKRHRIMQSWHGAFSHNYEGSAHALDLQAKVGSPIYAARAGTVVRVVEHHTEFGGREFVDKANMILILHKDGSIANYVHLKHDGVIVEVGDQVIQRQEIGYVGMTGFTTKPHLHFVVRDGAVHLVPFYFMGYEGQILKVGQKIRRR
jgi:murein DD-endopeptidase MepM/ murein hydrolase activator NlpD